MSSKALSLPSEQREGVPGFRWHLEGHLKSQESDAFSNKQTLPPPDSVPSCLFAPFLLLLNSYLLTEIMCSCYRCVFLEVEESLGPGLQV